MSAINYSGRASQLGRIINLADQRLSSISRSEQNFVSPEFRKKVPEGSTLISVDTRVSSKHSVGLVQRSPHAKNQIIPSIRLEN